MSDDQHQNPPWSGPLDSVVVFIGSELIALPLGFAGVEAAMRGDWWHFGIAYAIGLPFAVAGFAYPRWKSAVAAYKGLFLGALFVAGLSTAFVFVLGPDIYRRAMTAPAGAGPIKPPPLSPSKAPTPAPNAHSDAEYKALQDQNGSLRSQLAKAALPANTVPKSVYDQKVSELAFARKQLADVGYGLMHGGFGGGGGGGGPCGGGGGGSGVGYGPGGAGGSGGNCPQMSMPGLLFTTPSTKADLEQKIARIEELHKFYQDDAMPFVSSLHALDLQKNITPENRQSFIQRLGDEAKACNKVADQLPAFKRAAWAFDDVQHLADFNCNKFNNANAAIVEFIKRFGPNDPIPYLTMSQLAIDRDDAVGKLGESAGGGLEKTEAARKQLPQ